MSHSHDQHEALVAALEFVIDGFLRHEIDHWQYRKRVYEVALDALGKPKDENLNNGFYDAFGGTISKTIAENAALKQRVEELEAAIKSIIDRSNNNTLGTSKVNDMRNIALAALQESQP